jgi:hypothetical protein
VTPSHSTAAGLHRDITQVIRRTFVEASWASIWCLRARRPGSEPRGTPRRQTRTIHPPV